MIGKTISHYKIIEKLGEGGMGVVYKAQDTKLDRFVALKFLPPALTSDSEAKERFIHEAKAASALEHSNICNIHEIDETEDGQMYIVMACYEGEILKERIERGPLKLEEAVNIAIQIAKGLEKAHKKEIVHRDIKPANIFITDDNVVKIVDFGLAKLAGPSQLTKTGTTLGTVSYMSPEQAKGENVDYRADIWSFGVVLYEILTGEKPFKGEYEQAVIYSILNEDPEPIEKYSKEIPEYLVGIIKKALEKNPDKRFQSISEISESIKKHKAPDGSLKKEAVSEKHNLPQRLTTFIGREKEIQKIKQFLLENRLVTLTGAGGCGKTRLAIQTASEIIDQYAGGVWFVDYAPLTDPKLLVNEVADVLKIKEEPNVLLIETVIKRIKDEKILIILDNCEHLISAISELSEKLLKSVPGLTLLVTSREALNISGELAWRVPSLSLPDMKKLPEAKQLIQYESIRLFTERAKNCQTSFQLSKKNGEEIARICSRLDGIPLAIELASARIKMFDVNTILNRLDDRFRLLTGGARTALERHKTLKATIDWSYDLLTEEEKLLFNRLSVFVGGCTIEAAETVCGIKPLENINVVDLFGSLIEKSLVVTDITQESTYRYRLLETLRHYAREKLVASDEADSIRGSHFQYYLGMAEEAYKFWNEERSKWFIQLETELENLRTALEWSKNRPEEYIRLAGALYNFWYEHSHIIEGYDYLNEALDKYKKEDEITARALEGKGIIESFMGNINLPLLEESLSIWRKLNDKRETFWALNWIIPFKCWADDLENMEKYIEESIQISEELGDEKLLLRIKTWECFYYVCSFKLEKALILAEKNIADTKRLNLQFEHNINLHFYADTAILSGNYDESEKRYGNALEAWLSIENIVQALFEMRGVSDSLSGQKRYVKAVRLHGAVDEKFKELGAVEQKTLRFWVELKNRALESAKKVLGEAAFQKAEEEGRKMGFEKAVEYVLDFNKD